MLSLLTFTGLRKLRGMSCYFIVDREFNDDEVLPIGRPFKNTDIILLDDNNRIPPKGEAGEICIKGDIPNPGLLQRSGKDQGGICTESAKRCLS